MTNNWWKKFFNGVALDFWRAVLSPEQTHAEADFIQKHLELRPNAKVLDVPCGNGRLAIELAKRGYKLTGIDIASEFIAEATRASIDAGVEVNWCEGDMRELPWTREFDAAFCFGNSFGYLDDQANQDFLKSLANTLKPGARFILDAPAVAECIFPNFQKERFMEIAGINVSIKHFYDHEAAVMHNDFTFRRDGVEELRPSLQRIYTYLELCNLLREAGFGIVKAFGSVEEERFKLGAHRLLLVSRKK